MPQDHDCVRDKKNMRAHHEAEKNKSKYDAAIKSAASKQNPTALKVAMMKLKMHSEV
jgi:hypothetical protein